MAPMKTAHSLPLPMRPAGFLLTTLAALALASCAAPLSPPPPTASVPPPAPQQQAPPPELPPAAPPKVKGFDVARSKASVDQSLEIPRRCKSLISSTMGRPVEIMTAQYPSEGDPSMAFVSYIRDDGTIWKYQCKTDGQTMVWRGVDIFSPGGGPGRWREEERVPLSSL